ncbi:uncharacterized protein SPPG_06524 [Spizellomyces punctatus DAOM BR117]|uniref:rRNA methyltransferase 1, mitochondrial n=1 Tax=Spizellomyces punctatus (strain DAOM BR117) TaxID=645134 RepID=A0A0L0H9B3_SPIPD|nr:uncharacterized protein SPPG_06524 [Spizellomyces punctatus DAOM BR117]KNC98115.1 hypothetical protein SPPG_06524 [Spizellomyces punctatus DAOM BR117]|eukprot:XP_016606155.1 hypothetical protein SPPG_06524 [Spizellomyces punctatus DAOM BR117]
MHPLVCSFARLLPAASYRTTAQRTLEHLYGASCVIPALEIGRRKLRKLYVKEGGELDGIRSSKRGDRSNKWVELALQLAQRREVTVSRVPASRLDALSDGRPHQGLVLAAAPLECVQLRHLGCWQNEGDSDSRYSAVITKRESLTIPFSSREGRRRHPIWLALDQIVDPQNLGGILRSAHFFDIDGVILTDRETAPFSPFVSKASAGALEVMDLYITPSLPKFLESSAENGWHIYGTDIHSDNTISLSEYSRAKHSGLEVPPLIHSPTILVLGSEGKGMRPVVSKACHDHLVIGDQVEDDEDAKGGGKYTVDSLNVSVAAGILMHTLVSA